MADKKSNSLFNPEYGAVLLLAALGIVLSTIAFLHLRQLDATGRRDAQDRQVAAAAASLREAIGQHLLVSRTLAGLFSRQAPVTRGEFQAFAARLFPAVGGLRAVAWMPRIPSLALGEFEAAAKDAGIAGFKVRPAAEGDLLSPDLFPVYFIEPMLANEAVLGVDAGSMRDRSGAMQAARDGGRTVATGRLTGDDGGTIVLITPVYAGGAVPDGLLERRSRLTGFLGVSLAIDEMAALALNAAVADADLYLYDMKAAEGRRLLHFRPAPLAGELRPPREERAVLSAAHQSRRIDAAGRPWLLVLSPTAPAAAGTMVPWAALVVGLGLTGLLAVLALGSVTRSRRAEELAVAIGESNEMLAREIAERRNVEAALRRTESRLQLALKSAPLSLFSQDTDLRYTWIFKSRLGLMLEETLGRTDFDLMSPRDAQLLTGIKRRVLETGVGCREEVHLDHEGRGIDLDLAIEPMFDAGGALAGIIGTAIDVTHERETQKRLAEARAEAERANDAKSRFLAAASHDLRQPLQAARLFLEVLEMRLADAPSRAIVGKALNALDSTNGLLNALLDISTLEAGVVQPDVSVFPVARLLDRLAEETAPQAESAGLRFSAVGSTALVRSDPVLLERMVRNLLSNALRYTRTGGILLGCRRVGHDRLRLDVCDTGPGIPADKLQIIFEDFYQLDNPDRDRGRGLGLGLSVVDRMARLLGHQVGVQSRPGRGSVFSITVPIAGMLPAEKPLERADAAE